MQLDPAAVAAGVRLAALATVDSTNREARACSRSGEAGPLWITAETQTAGRGRGDRSWFSPPGNLYASLLMREPAPPGRVPELAFVAALAVRDAIGAAAPALAPQLALKWPNDVLLAGGKCAGILIEGEHDPSAGMSVIIGIGVNCAHYPESAGTIVPRADEPTLYPATALSAHGAKVAPEQLFARLSATMMRRLAQWDHGGGFDGILMDWLEAARGLGEPIRVRTPNGERIGRFAGVDAAGRLMLGLSDGGTELISAGDVFPLTEHITPATRLRKVE
jgi:BirA family transcriptional regulator, biotin operon repressor / biotin---[acetyl-CoA-carboxylase] ligase